MLDKSVPFHTIIMKRPYIKPPIITNIPEGFKVKSYEDENDEIGWAEIEKDVLEFNSKEEAVNCHKGYLSCLDELKKRQWFTITDDGKYASTATVWWQDSENGRIPVVHALGCKSEYQGKGLGRIAAIKMLESFYELDKNKEIWLDTQTWSYKAIGLYLSLGFVPLKKDTFNETKNEFDEAVPILREHMKKELFERFMESAK